MFSQSSKKDDSKALTETVRDIQTILSSINDEISVLSNKAVKWIPQAKEITVVQHTLFNNLFEASVKDNYLLFGNNQLYYIDLFGHQTLVHHEITNEKAQTYIMTPEAAKMRLSLQLDGVALEASMLRFRKKLSDDCYHVLRTQIETSRIKLSALVEKPSLFAIFVSFFQYPPSQKNVTSESKMEYRIRDGTLIHAYHERMWRKMIYEQHLNNHISQTNPTARY